MMFYGAMLRAGEPTAVHSSPANGEFLDDGIRQQFSRKLGDPSLGGIVGIAELYLKSLALADGEHLAETEPAAGSRDGLALRVMDLWFQHDVDDDRGHSGSVRQPRST
jgi:hypothetical protein